MKFPNDSTDTPERVEFENLDFDNEDDGNVSRNEMDEDEWTDHNFGTSANELASSDDVSDLRFVTCTRSSICGIFIYRMISIDAASLKWRMKKTTMNLLKL